MATFYRCDRCQKEDTKPLFFVTIPIVSRYDRSSYRNRTDYDKKEYELCEDCMVRLNELVKEKPSATAPGTFIEVK